MKPEKETVRRTEERNAEDLRDEYNQAYSQPRDRWSLHDPARASALVASVCGSIVGGRFDGKENPRCLDVGCGKGTITDAWRKAGFDAHGLDYSDVAIERARELYPRCTFHHKDGFRPELDLVFDVIFMRGFSGVNTHDMEFVVDLANRYVAILKSGGVFINAFPTDYSGRERESQTVNWSRDEIERYTENVGAKPLKTIVLEQGGPVARCKKWLRRRMGKRVARDYVYCAFEKD